MNYHVEFARREARLAAMAEAKSKIEVRDKARFAREQADYQASTLRSCTDVRDRMGGLMLVMWGAYSVSSCARPAVTWPR
jgi:hypothetical protein